MIDETKCTAGFVKNPMQRMPVVFTKGETPHARMREIRTIFVQVGDIQYGRINQPRQPAQMISLGREKRHFGIRGIVWVPIRRIAKNQDGLAVRVDFCGTQDTKAILPDFPGVTRRVVIHRALPPHRMNQEFAAISRQKPQCLGTESMLFHPGSEKVPDVSQNALEPSLVLVGEFPIRRSPKDDVWRSRRRGDITLPFGEDLSRPGHLCIGIRGLAELGE